MASIKLSNSVKLSCVSVEQCGIDASNKIADVSKNCLASGTATLEWTATADCLVFNVGYTGYGSTYIDNNILFSGTTGSYSWIQPLPIKVGQKIKMTSAVNNSSLIMRIQAYGLK